MIRISTGSAVRWAKGWAPANSIFYLCQLKCFQDNVMYMRTPFLDCIRFMYINVICRRFAVNRKTKELSAIRFIVVIQ